MQVREIHIIRQGWEETPPTSPLGLTDHAQNTLRGISGQFICKLGAVWRNFIQVYHLHTLCANTLPLKRRYGYNFVSKTSSYLFYVALNIVFDIPFLNNCYLQINVVIVLPQTRQDPFIFRRRMIGCVIALVWLSGKQQLILVSCIVFSSSDNVFFVSCHYCCCGFVTFFLQLSS